MLYSKIYPTGSSLGRFYGFAKLYKVKCNGAVEDLPLRTIIWNIGTARQIATHNQKLQIVCENMEKTKDPSWTRNSVIWYSVTIYQCSSRRDNQYNYQKNEW